MKGKHRLIKYQLMTMTSLICGKFQVVRYHNPYPQKPRGNVWSFSLINAPFPRNLLWIHRYLFNKTYACKYSYGTRTAPMDHHCVCCFHGYHKYIHCQSASPRQAWQLRIQQDGERDCWWKTVMKFWKIEASKVMNGTNLKLLKKYFSNMYNQINLSFTPFPSLLQAT